MGEIALDAGMEMAVLFFVTGPLFLFGMVGFFLGTTLAGGCDVFTIFVDAVAGNVSKRTSTERPASGRTSQCRGSGSR